jgi:hypothetical protein
VTSRGAAPAGPGDSPRLGDDLVPHPDIQEPGQRRVQQRPRVVPPQAGHHQLRQPGQFLARHPGREDDSDRLGREPPGHEPEDLRRGPVQPLRVIDQADQRPTPGHLGQQAEHREAHQEPVGRGAVAQAERDAQRVALGWRQPFGVIKHRPAQLMQPGEGQLHLGLHAGRAGDAAPGRLAARVVEQCRLPHARLTAQHEDPALARPRRVDEPVERGAFLEPVRELGRVAPRPVIADHPVPPFTLARGG